jgi:hypothetical protein
MATQGVDELRTLTHQDIAGPKRIFLLFYPSEPGSGTAKIKI